MLQTVEIRWFFDEQPLVEDLHFETATELQQRTDWYLMPGNPKCGTKVREGMLETKLQVDSFGVRSFAAWEGVLEAYKKWSLKFPEDDRPSVEEMRGVEWLAVKKRRRLQRFEVAADGVQPTSVRPTNGCEFEMTDLEVGNDVFWTVGFEAVGSPDALESNVRAVAAEVTRRGGLLAQFTSANSFGYAQWLTDLKS